MPRAQVVQLFPGSRCSRLPERRRQFFVANGECLEVRPEIRRRVSFRELNLIGDGSFPWGMDIVFCRNVLIYFASERKRRIVRRLARALNPGGYLLRGSTESLSGYGDGFEMVVACGGIAYRKAG